MTTSSHVGRWRPNDFWQNINAGYRDFAGTSWNANPNDGIGINPFSIADSVLTITCKRTPSEAVAAIEAEMASQGVGGTAPAWTGGNNDGVRAANFSWLGGLITGDDLEAGVIDHALVLALTYYTLDGNGSDYNWVSPATAKDVGGAVGPIKMGTKIGIPHGVSPPSGLTSVGVMLWDCLQQFGAFVGDYAGGPWPTFYTDAGSVTDASVLDPWFAWWDIPSRVTELDKISPYLKVTGG